MNVTDGKMSTYFLYNVPVVTSLAAGASISQAISFDQDSRFYWTHTSYFVDLSAAAVTDSARPIPLITVNMIDTGSGRALTFSPMPIDCLAGYKASELYKLPQPRIFSPSATMRVTFANYSAATTYTNLYLVLHGYKVFDTK